MIKESLFVLCLTIGQQVHTGKTELKTRDTLRNKEYSYLFDRIESEKTDTKRSVYLRAFLNKAKTEQNREEIVNGYKNYLHHSDDNLKLVYADSMIYEAKESMDNVLIGSAYLSKGIVYYGRKNHIEALDNYLIANEYISKTDDRYQQYKTKYHIAHIKYYLENYDEAISLYKECADYFKDEDNKGGYLNSLHSISLCYNRIGDFGHSSEIIELGLAESKRHSNKLMEAYFIHLDGVNSYFKDNYASSIEKINQSLPTIISNNDFANETIGYFYIGKSYWAMKKPKEAIKYFQKVDDIFEEKEYIRPDLRENYELLINYYKSKNNLPTELFYIKKLIKADSILNTNYQYLSTKVHKEYDTKGLLEQKERIQNLLEKRKKNDILFISALSFLFFALLFLTYRYLRNKKIYKKRFEELMKKNGKTETTEKTKSADKTELDINPDAVATVIKQLEKFERDKKFIEKDWTLVKLSAAFNSNTKYLSKIVFHYRGKGFVEYINDLKVDYIVELLKKDKRIRNYTNKSLAEEVGFSSTQRFTNAFISRTGISPTYFIQELNKQENSPTESID